MDGFSSFMDAVTLIDWLVVGGIAAAVIYGLISMLWSEIKKRVFKS